jgi:cyclohexa-1,5-dienecarbonyl-CoA hydratase
VQSKDKTRIEIARHANAITISLSNPPVNVIDLPMIAELTEAISEIELQSDISVIVIRGQGKSFSAGVAVQAHTPDNIQNLLTNFHALIRALTTSKKISIAAVRGHCLGGAAELAMACDIVYTSKKAQWAFPEIELGCYPPVAVTVLSAIVGQKRAAELILTGRNITGVEAANMGLTTQCVGENKLDAIIAQTVKQLNKLSPAVLALAKKAIYAWDSMHFDKGLARAEKIYLEELMQTEDAKEGINAFLQKRKPQWKGK